MSLKEKEDKIIARHNVRYTKCCKNCKFITDWDAWNGTGGECEKIDIGVLDYWICDEFEEGEDYNRKLTD